MLLDAHGAPVAPAIAWHDSRGTEQAERMAAELGSARFAERTGLAPRPLCSLAKYRWLREQHEPAERGVRWLSVGEWIVHRLGGDQVAELSLASRTGWLDIHARDWWDEALAWSGAPAGLLCRPGAGDDRRRHGRRRAAARARRGAGGRRSRPPERRRRRGRHRRGRRAGLVGHRPGLHPRGRAARSRRRPRGGGGAGQRRLARGRGAPVPARRDALRRRAGAGARPARRRPGGPRGAGAQRRWMRPPQPAGSSCTASTRIASR